MHDCATQDTLKLETHYLDHILGTVYKKRVALAADTATPAWGFSSQFTLPADCLRLLKNIRL
jgi:hypothetical protein